MKRRMSILLFFSLLLLSTTFVYAKTGSGYDLTWTVVAGGGSVSAGGDYALNSTSGQSQASFIKGGGYELHSGFWGTGATSNSYRIYLPLIDNLIILVNPSSARLQTR